MINNHRTRSYDIFKNLKMNKKMMLAIPFFILVLLFVIIPVIIIITYAFLPTSSGDISHNWEILNHSVILKILRSIYISFVSTLVCVLIAYPFCYFLSMSKNKAYKSIVMLIITAPIWSSLLIKLIGLKTLFDTINGAGNSTYGDIFTIIGLTYIYLPFMMMPLYNSFETLPKNLIYASRDLGRNFFSTFFKVILPYTKQALIAGITLVYLPSLTSVAISAFLNNNNDGTLIGGIIEGSASNANSSDIALARVSVLSLVIGLIILFMYAIYVLTPKLYKLIKQTNSMKASLLNEK